MGRYPRPKLAARMHFFYLKKALKLEKKANMENCQYLENGRKYREKLKISAKVVL